MKRFRLKIWSFHEQNGWKKKKKKPFGQLLQAKCLKEKRTFHEVKTK